MSDTPVRSPKRRMSAELPRFERAIRVALAIQRGEAIGVHWLMEKLGLSLAQAKRDLLEIERCLPVRRERRGNRVVLIAGPL